MKPRSSVSSPPSSESFEAPYNRVIDAVADVVMTTIFAYLALRGVLNAAQFVTAVALVSLPPQILVRIARLLDARHSRVAIGLMAVAGTAYAAKIALAVVLGASLAYTACASSVRATFEYNYPATD